MPLELKLKNFPSGEKVIYHIETIEEGKIFKIHFKNAPDVKGNINAVLYLSTSYPEKPEISITVKGKFREKVAKKDNNDRETESQ